MVWESIPKITFILPNQGTHSSHGNYNISRFSKIEFYKGQLKYQFLATGDTCSGILFDHNRQIQIESEPNGFVSSE